MIRTTGLTEFSCRIMVLKLTNCQFEKVAECRASDCSDNNSQDVIGEFSALRLVGDHPHASAELAASAASALGTILAAVTAAAEASSCRRSTLRPGSDCLVLPCLSSLRASERSGIRRFAVNHDHIPDWEPPCHGGQVGQNIRSRLDAGWNFAARTKIVKGAGQKIIIFVRAKSLV